MFATIANVMVYFTALTYLSQFGFAAGLGSRLSVILQIMVVSPSFFLVGFLSLGLSLTLSWVLRLPPVRHLATQVSVVVFMLPILVWNTSVTLVLLSLEALVDMYYGPVFFVFGLLISWIIESVGLRNLRAVVSSLEVDNISLRTQTTSLSRDKELLNDQLSSMHSTLCTERRALADHKAEIVHLKERAIEQQEAAADQILTEQMKHRETRLKYERAKEKLNDALRAFRSLQNHNDHAHERFDDLRIHARDACNAYDEEKIKHQSRQADDRKRIQALEDIQSEHVQRIRSLESYVDKLKKEAEARDERYEECKKLVGRQAFEILKKDLLLLSRRNNISDAPTVKPPVMVTSQSDTDSSWEHSMSFTQIVSPQEQFEVSGEVEEVETSSVYSSAMVLDRTSEYNGSLEVEKVEKEEFGSVEQSRQSVSMVGQVSTSSHFVEPSTQEERLLRSSVSMRPILDDLSSAWSLAPSALTEVSTTQEASARVGTSTMDNIPGITQTLDIPRISDTDNSLLINGSLPPRTSSVASWPRESSSSKAADSQEDLSFMLFQPQASSTPRSQSLLSRPGTSSRLVSSYMLSQPQASLSSPHTPHLPPSIHPPKLRFSDNLLLSNGSFVPRPPTLFFGPSGSPPPTATGSRLASPFLHFRPQSSSFPRSGSFIRRSEESLSLKATGSPRISESPFARFRPQSCSSPWIPWSPRLLTSEISRFPF
ncbi:hypothetical protein NLI96_g10179 [Meripilus lineatus]|uniref:Uncharacterized protein n=1 Tax=Meripilus lineatus TaxID=2056292 RepID=A0AAD5UYN4_9APHY|nr:hypothetical protein NLI96_g10179 [Physisporinus lineatus]